MSVINPYIESTLELMDKIPDIAKDSLIANLDVIEYLIKEEQLAKGLRSDGKIAGTYAPNTPNFAEQDRQASGGRFPREDKVRGFPYNFDWTGSFKDGIYVKVNDDDGFDILTRDGKLAILEQMAKGRLLKLTEEHNTLINEKIIMPAISKFISQNLFVL